MTINEYWTLVSDTFERYPDWRYGQTAFNVLFAVRPDIAEAVRGTDADPFNVQSAYLNPEPWTRFVDAVTARW